ncbi:MAG: DUF3857 domain-containing protein [Cyclobacteriaceae bacterium]|nr:MAG: DUF3857 domain-containing protein [Cyclobacteriaceae bacterium]
MSVLRLYGILLLGLYSSALTAQKLLRPSNIGIIDTTWLTMKNFEADSTALAVILFDYGKCTADPYWGTTLTVQRRIKIFKKEAFDDWGNYTIKAEDSKLLDFSGTVYNLDQNRNITKTRLNLKDVFNEKRKGNLDTKIFFPNIKEGSIIEFTYTIKTSSYAIFEWHFQHSIPVQQSEYEVFFPGSIFGVAAIINGLYDLDVSVKQEGKLRKYTLTNVPAFKEEPFMPNPKLYRSSIIFPPRFKQGFSEEYTKDYLLKHGITRDSAKMDTRMAVQSNFKIDPKGNLDGTIIVDLSGYEATLARKKIEELGQDRFLKEELGDKVWTVKNQTLQNVADKNLSLVAKYELFIPNHSIVTDSLIYINPYLGIKEENNPFKLERRNYPVDLGARIERVITTVLTMPKGYEVDELPASGIIELPNKTATFTISTTNLADNIFVTSRLKFNKVIYNVPEYPALREFFSRVVAKQSEQIVLRKSQ